MPRRPRHPLEPGLYHITVKGIRDEPIFLDDFDRFGLIRLLGDVHDQENFLLRGFFLMTTHYHLTIETHTGELSRPMKHVNHVHALRFNRAHGYGGHLLRDRYSAKPIRDEWHLYEVVRYLARNPVKAGLCKRPEDWRWGSFAIALGLAPCPPFFDATWTLRLFSEDDEEAKRQLVGFVNYEPEYAHI